MREENTAFETVLRRGLMDANLLDFREVLDNAVTPDFSAKYLRQRMRMLANPYGWMRRMIRPVWKQVLYRAACVLLACLLTLGALMAASPTVRAAVLNWFREFTGSVVHYFSRGERELYEVGPAWRLTRMPDGWALESFEVYNGLSVWDFRKGRERIQFSSVFPGNEGGAFGSFFARDAEKIRTETTVQGYAADYYEGLENALLVWEDEDGNQFSLSGWYMEDFSILRETAESVALYPEDAGSWKMTWVPEGLNRLDRSAVQGIGTETYVMGTDSLTWQYVVDPVCPLLLPDRPPEECTVNGVPAQFWPSERPKEENDDDGTMTVIVNGAGYTIQNGEPIDVNGTVITAGSAQTWNDVSFLTWSSPEDGTVFLIKSNFPLEALLRMAESIVRTDAPNNALFQRPEPRKIPVEGNAAPDTVQMDSADFQNEGTAETPGA